MNKLKKFSNRVLKTSINLYKESQINNKILWVQIEIAKIIYKKTIK